METELHAEQLRRLQQMQDAEQRALAEREQETAAAAQAQQQQAKRAQTLQSLKSALAITSIGALVLWLCDDKKEAGEDRTDTDAQDTKAQQATPPAQAHATHYTPQQIAIILQLQSCAGDLGKTMLTLEEVAACFNGGLDTIEKHFGGFHAALEAAGLTLHAHHTPNTTPIPVALITADLKRVARALGKQALTPEEYQEHGGVMLSCVEGTFGSFEAAVLAAGLLVDRHRNILDAELLAALRRVAEKCRKRAATIADYDAHGGVGSRVLSARFGSWEKALAAAGLEQPKSLRVPDSDLIADVVRVAAILKKRPDRLTRTEYDRKGHFSSSTISRRMGSWTRAMSVIQRAQHKG